MVKAQTTYTGQIHGKRGIPHKTLHLLRIVSVCLLSSFLLFLTACSNIFAAPAQSGASTVTAQVTPTRAVSPTPTSPLPTITLQVVGCPTLSINWDTLVGTRANVNKVQKVTCGSLEGAGSVVAVVAVRYYTPDAKLDVYVYDNLAATPAQRFKLTGLLDGDAQISPTGTLLTAETGANGDTKVQNIFKEYQWNGSAFGQVLFPFLYPDMTHYQAEQDQARFAAASAAGRATDQWKTSGVLEAEHLAQYVFFWTNVSKTVLQFNQAQDIVQVQVTNLGTGGGGFIATFHHLDGNANNIYEVASITGSDGYTAITNPTSGAQLASPVSVAGTTLAAGKILGVVLVYDDTFTKVGTSDDITSPLNSGLVSYTGAVKYALSTHGMQEGVVAFYGTTQNNTAFRSQVTMIKVFLSA